MRRLLVAGVVLLALVLGVGASTAGAHAALEATAPAAGAALDAPPEEIVLTFNEPVELELGGVRVYDQDRELVSGGEQADVTGDGRTIVSPLPELGDGTYVVTWRVTSADSHPISGAFGFTVGEVAAADDTASLVDELLAAEGGSEAAGVLYAIDRAAVFAGLAGLVGLWAFAWLIAPRAPTRRAYRRLVWGSWALLVVATAASIGLQGVTAGGFPLGDALDPSVWSAVLETRFGQMALVRLLVLLAAVPLLLLLRGADGAGDGAGDRAADGGRLPAWWAATTGALSLGLVLTVAWAGHAGAGRYVGLAMFVDVLHQLAMAVWLGGLVGLFVVVFPSDDDELWAAVPRYSTVAFTCVVFLVTTGAVQAWRQLGTVEALTQTNYGRVLLVKLGVVAGLVGVAALSRGLVQRRLHAPQPLPAGPGAMVASDPADPTDRRSLRRSVAFEVVLGVAVLAVTAVLVNLPPGIDAVDEPWTGRLDAGELSVDVTIDPAAAGPVTMHIYVLSSAGTPAEVEDLTAELTLPAEDIGPFEVPVERVGPGHYTIADYEIPFDGDWTLAVGVRVSEFELVDAETTVPIR